MVALEAFNNGINELVHWAVDSGASHTMYPDKSVFNNFIELRNPVEISGISGKVDVVSIGHIKIRDG